MSRAAGLSTWVNGRRLCLFGVAVWFLLDRGPAAAEPVAPVKLPSTRVNMPWDQIVKLLDHRVDTVYKSPPDTPPVPATFDRADLYVLLGDSSVSCRADIAYTVLASERWVCVPFAPSDADLRFSRVGMPPGDFLSVDDDGYRIIAQGRSGSTVSRTMSCVWSAAAGANEGQRTTELFVPRAPRGQIEITTPVGFGDVQLGGTVRLGSGHTSGGTLITFSLPSSGERAALTYVAPVKIPRDTARTPIVRVQKLPSRMTVEHELVVFAAEERRVVLDVLHVAVVHAPVHEIRLRLPANLSLLEIVGNGIVRTQIAGRDIVLPLAFDLEGDYDLTVAGEIPADTTMQVRPVELIGAARQAGRFAVGAGGTTEVRLVELAGGQPVPRQEFLTRLSPTLTDAVARYKQETRDIMVCWSCNDTPCTATIALRAHQPVAVADAIADSGLLVTAISAEHKSITHALYRIRQRDRQFVALTLPDSAVLWAASLNGVKLVPFRDQDGRLKVPLQRYVDERSADEAVNLEITYFENRGGGRGNSFRFRPSVPDMPVTALSWTVFFPSRWNLRALKGDFQIRDRGLSIRRTAHSVEQIEQYKKLRSASDAQQATTASAADLMVMPESPRYVVVRRMLVLDERPELRLEFILVAVQNWAFIALLAAILGWGTWRFVVNRRTCRQHARL